MKRNRITGHIARLAAGLASNRRGALAVHFALIAIPLTVAAGLGIDGSRMLLARYQLQASLDASALAVGASYGDQTELQAMLDAFVRKNFQVKNASVTNVTLSGTGADVIVNGTASLDMLFGRALGYNSITVAASTEVKRAGGGLIVSLALDNTGSMWGSNNIASLRKSTTTLLKELFGTETAPSDLRVAIVPFASTVNVGGEWEKLIDTDDLEDLYDDYLDDIPDEDDMRSDTIITNWKGCVIEREDHSISDTPPDEDDPDTLWKPFWYPPGRDNNYDPKKASTIIVGGAKDSNQITGPNIGCPTPITALTNNFAVLTAANNAITAWNRGGTLNDIGLAWAYRTLTPGEPFTQSTELDTKDAKTLWASPRWRKAIVLMTDGENTIFDFDGTGQNKGVDKPLPAQGSKDPNVGHISKSDYTGYGRLGESLMTALFSSDNGNTVRDKVNARVASQCATYKAQGVIIYSVVFTSSVNDTTKNMYKACASDPGKYWYAPNQASLEGAFGAIGADLAKLRIVK